MTFETVRAITGITPDQLSDLTMHELAKASGIQPCGTLDMTDALRVGILAAEAMAARSVGQSAVTRVEDITIDHGRAVTLWLSVADRLRTRLEEREHDDGPVTIEFSPYPVGVEGVPRGIGAL